MAYVSNSYLMVDFFFVLSGFVIFYSSYQKIRDAGSFGRFIWRRFWRLYPLHFTILALFVLMDAAKFPLLTSWLHHGFTYNVPFGGRPGAFVGMVTSNLLLIHDLPWAQDLSRGTTAGDTNVPSWSISCEFYIYLVFAALVMAVGVGRKAFAAFALVVLASGVGLFALADAGIDSSAGFFGILRCLCGFFLGAMTFMAYLILKSNASRSLSFIALAACMGFFLFVAVERGGRLDIAVYPLAALTVLLVALSSGQYAVRFLCAAPFRWLGAISYSIYMTHYFIIKILATTLRFTFDLPFSKLVGENLIVLHPGPALATGATAVAIVAILGASDFTYRMIEKPFREWSKEYSSHSSP